MPVEVQALQAPSKTVAVSLVLGFAFTTVAAYYATDRTQDSWWVTFWGVTGSSASVLGIIYAIVQLHYIKKEAAIIAKTSAATRRDMLELTHFADLERAIKLIQEIQSHVRSLKHEMAVVRLQELKIIIGQVNAATPSAQPRLAFDQMLLKLNFLIAGIEKDIENKTKALQVARANGELEGILDSLVTLQTQIIAKR